MISGSCLERVEACPGSETLEHVDIESVHAKRGSKLHDEVGDLVDGNGASLPSQEAQRIYDAIRPHTEGMASERAIVIDTVAGTARHVGYRIGRKYGALRFGEIPLTLDFSDARRLVELKTGWGFVWGPAVNLQIQAQALGLALVEGVSSVVATLAQVPLGKPAYVSEPYEFNRLDLDEVLTRLRSIVRGVSKARALASAGSTPEFRPGPWCRYCPGQRVCEVRED